MEVTKRGLTFSRLTLGTVQLGLPYGIANKNGKPDETTASTILDAAVAGGITSFDTANTYGNAEQVLSDYFEHRPQRQPRPLIVTKMHLRADAGTTPEEVERMMYANAASSLGNLRLTKLPVLMLHNPEVLDTHEETVTRVAKQLVKEGLVERMGVSLRVYTHAQFDELWQTVQDDVYEAVQVPINILDTRLLAYRGLQRLDQAGKLVFARSVFLQGLLFMEDRELPNHLRDAAAPLSVLRAVAAREGMTVAQLAFSFVRDLPEIDSLVFGAETPGQVRDNLRLFHGPAISEAARAEILASFADMPEHIVNPAVWEVAKS